MTACLGPEAGSYLLIVDLGRPLALDIDTLARATLPPGRYVYCGSAYGPGGMGARVRRHLRRDKVIRWHVDRLTGPGMVVAVGLAPGGQECDLMAAVLVSKGAHTPVPGFGNSDCRRCPAHLASVAPGFDGESINLPNMSWVAEPMD